MYRTTILASMLIALLTLVACSEKPPDVEWELVIDGDVEQVQTYTYQDLAKRRHIEITDILTHNPENPGEKTSWKGIPIRRLFLETGGVELVIDWFALITLADGSTFRLSTADLRGTIVALKDGEGNWLAETDEAPIRLIIISRPSTDWLAGPVRITIQKP